jgi:TonB family protein
MWGQITGSPVLVEKPAVAYPPIAKAAHVTGDVVVRFSIKDDGRTSSIEVISGALMLRSAVADKIKDWRFEVPLPLNAQRDFEAVYTFGHEAPDETLDDDLDGPPYYPCCGDLILLPPGASQVTGEVRSVDGSQKIDVSPAAPKPPADRCPNDTERQVPQGSDGDDYVELLRACMKGCRDYRVRVYRGGQVEWVGRDDVALKGVEQTSIRGELAAALMARFQSPMFWSACSKMPPTPEEDRDAEPFQTGTYLAARIRNHVKSVDAYSADGDAMQRLVWAVEKAADTHRWIHGDAAVESWRNMAEDIGMPKPGMTALIRATFHFSQTSAQQSTDALKRLLATPGVDVDAADESGWTALMYAAELTYDDKEIGMLLDAQANANRVSLHGDTALMMAAYNGRLSERLMKSGADINARNAGGVTALMLLAQRADPDELKEAIDAGADAAAKDREGRTALEYLHAASCEKPIVPLPQPWAQIVPKEPPPCPANSEEYRKSEAVLKATMKRRTR